MRRPVLLFILLTAAWALLPATAGGLAGQDDLPTMTLDLSGAVRGRQVLDGASSWSPEEDPAAASWCSADSCADSAAIMLPADATPGTYHTDGTTLFAAVLGSQDVLFASAAGECTIEVAEISSLGLSGRLRCKDLATDKGMIDVRGSFSGGNGLGMAGGALPQNGVPGTERIHSYDVALVVRPDGILEVTETIDYDFGDYAIDRHGIYRDIPNRFTFDETQDRIMPIEVRSVEATGGASADHVVENLGDGQLRIKVGDADRTVEGRHTYTIRYEVEGALNALKDHDELYWNAIGDQWTISIGEASVTLEAPEISEIACYAGYEGSRAPCTDAVLAGKARFVQDGLGPSQGLTIAAAFPKGVIDVPPPILRERWSIGRAFSFTPATGAGTASVLALFLGAFGLLVWRNGRDRRYAGGSVAASMGSEGMDEETVPLLERGEMPVEFAPPDDIRPGQVGTLIDEVANPLDVSATIVDLAVRGYLTIEEIPKEGLFDKPDWRLTKAQDPPRLLEYERRLYDGLFADAEDGSVLLSDLKTKFVDRLKTVQDALYRDAVRRKWFSTSPDKVRGRWTAIGWLLIVLAGGLTFVLAKWTHWGLLGIAAVVGGLVFAVGSRWMPRRTAAGTAMVRRIKGFRRFIESPTQTGIAKMSEREHLFSEYLPYAIVFGCTDKWAKAFEQLGIEPDESTWFLASRRLAYADLGNAFDSFATVATGTVAATPASSGGSGFGGGGFSGGGGGGGGGGSW